MLVVLFILVLPIPNTDPGPPPYDSISKGSWETRETTEGLPPKILLSSNSTNRFSLILSFSFTALLYLIRPPSGNKSPSTTPAVGEAGLTPNKFKWVPEKPANDWAIVEVGK